MKALLWALPLLAACHGTPTEQRVVDREGRIRALVSRVDGKKNGPVRFLNPDGGLRTEGHYTADSRNGAWTTFGAKHDTLSVLQFNRGKKEGYQGYWAPNGQLLRLERFHDAEPDGPLYRFFSDGAPRQFTTYERGIPEGDYLEWYKTDSTSIALTMGHFSKGKRSGTWHWFFGNGKLAARGRYENGDRTGPWLKWTPDGKLESRVVYGE